jgi:hypothetical protein
MLNARDQFARADRLVSEYKERIARQRAVIELAKRRGHPTAASESILRSLHESLRAFEKHRQGAFDRLEATRKHASAGGSPLHSAAPAVKREAEEDWGGEVADASRHPHVR